MISWPQDTRLLTTPPLSCIQKGSQPYLCHRNWVYDTPDDCDPVVGGGTVKVRPNRPSIGASSVQNGAAQWTSIKLARGMDEWAGQGRPGKGRGRGFISPRAQTPPIANQMNMFDVAWKLPDTLSWDGHFDAGKAK